MAVSVSSSEGPGAVPPTSSTSPTPSRLSTAARQTASAAPCTPRRREQSLLAPVRRTFRDYSLEKPVGDEAFRVIRGAYAYAPRELKASVDEVDDSSPYWRKEKVSFSAAYGDERVPAFVFLPKNARPPYQALVYHPSAGAASSTFASMEGFNRMEFIIRSGRAVIYPIYIGTFNRRLPPPASAIELKERVVKRFQDMRQSVEYLVSRDDIDASKLGYFGASWGAAWAPVMVSLEERFRTAVLFEGGLYLSSGRGAGGRRLQFPSARPSPGPHAERAIRLHVSGGQLAEAVLPLAGYAGEGQAARRLRCGPRRDGQSDRGREGSALLAGPVPRARRPLNRCAVTIWPGNHRLPDV